MKNHMVNQEDVEVDEKISLKKSIKKIATKIPTWWQSNDEDFKNMYKGAGIFFLIFIPCVLYFLAIYNDRDLISLIVKVVFAYLATFTLSTSVAMLIWGFYVNNSFKILKYAKWLFLLLLVIISLLEFVIGIPALLIFLVIEKIIDRRAKTFENVIKCFLALIFIIFVLAFLLSLNLSISIWIVNIISISLPNINVFRCISFMLITLCVVESFLLCSIPLLFWKHRENRKIDSEENNVDITNKRLIEYVWNSIKRIWLLFLVIIFAAITFNILNIEGIESYGDDINDVLTIYTLILLYLDKRKQWN